MEFQISKRGNSNNINVDMTFLKPPIKDISN
jgi:hypothetical protein